MMINPWFGSVSEGRKRITSSMVRSIAKQKLLYSAFQGNSATRWGLEQEQHSVAVYASLLHERGSHSPIININCGLVVCIAYPWLAATPDGWVSDSTVSPSQGLVEFKNPYSYRNLAVNDAITAKKCDCLSINNSHITLKRTHSFYYQVQVVVFCTKTKWYDFFFHTTVDYHCERVQFKESFCGIVLPTLRYFYVLAILPELTLKAKLIQEPNNCVTEEETFLQEIAEVVT